MKTELALRKNANNALTYPKQERGITLVALIITIIILVILAAVAISAAYNSGIIGFATRGVANYAEAGVNENRVMNDTIAYVESVVQDIYDKMGGTGGNPDEPGDDSDTTSHYSDPQYESMVAPTELFDFEILTEPQSVSTYSLRSTSAGDKGTAKITGVKSDYLSNIKPSWAESDVANGYYYIDYPGVEETLVVPYEVEIGGLLYDIVDVDLVGQKGSDCPVAPAVETIVFPDTVLSVHVMGFDDYAGYWPLSYGGTNTIKSIFLPSSLKSASISELLALEYLGLPEGMGSLDKLDVQRCTGLSRIEFPSSCPSIGYCSFRDCRGLKTVVFNNPRLNLGEVSAVYGGFGYAEDVYVRGEEGSLDTSLFPEGCRFHWNYSAD